MSDPQDSSRPTNFVEGPARPPRRAGSRGGPSRPPRGSDTVLGRLSAVLGRLPVPLPVATAACALIAVLLAGAIVIKIVGSGSASADKVDATPAPNAVPAATAPPATLIPQAPLSTRPPADENAARRSAFLETMKSLGLTPAQAECAATKVEWTIGWSELSESIMDPGKPGQLEDLMVGCVKG